MGRVSKVQRLMGGSRELAVELVDPRVWEVAHQRLWMGTKGETRGCRGWRRGRERMEERDQSEAKRVRKREERWLG